MPFRMQFSLEIVRSSAVLNRFCTPAIPLENRGATSATALSAPTQVRHLPGCNRCLPRPARGPTRVPGRPDRLRMAGAPRPTLRVAKIAAPRASPGRRAARAGQTSSTRCVKNMWHGARASASDNVPLASRGARSNPPQPAASQHDPRSRVTCHSPRGPDGADPDGEQAAICALPDQAPAGLGDVQEGGGQLLDRRGD